MHTIFPKLKSTQNVMIHMHRMINEKVYDFSVAYDFLVALDVAQISGTKLLRQRNSWKCKNKKRKSHGNTMIKDY